MKTYIGCMVLVFAMIAVPLASNPPLPPFDICIQQGDMTEEVNSGNGVFLNFSCPDMHQTFYTISPSISWTYDGTTVHLTDSEPSRNYSADIKVRLAYPFTGDATILNEGTVYSLHADDYRGAVCPPPGQMPSPTPVPTPQFSVVPVSSAYMGVVPFSVSLGYRVANGTPTGQTWFVNGVQFSTATSPVLKIAAAGLYTVRVVVLSSGASAQGSLTINAMAAPMAMCGGNGGCK